MCKVSRHVDWLLLVSFHRILVGCVCFLQCFLVNKEGGNSNWHKTGKNATLSKKSTCNARKHNTNVEEKEDRTEKLSFSKSLFIFCQKVLGERCGTLTEVVCGKNTRACKTVCTFKTTPLHCHCKKDWVKSNEMVRLFWQSI